MIRKKNIHILSHPFILIQNYLVYPSNKATYKFIKELNYLLPVLVRVSTDLFYTLATFICRSI